MRKSEKIEYALLGLIVLFAAFLRIYGLGHPPLWVDESISAVASLNILEKGVPVLDSGLLYGRAYVFHYLQAFFLLFGQSDFLVRFISVIFGLLTVILGYFLGREYSKSGGIIAALFMAVFYIEVFFSRQARFYQLFQLAFFASLYFLYKSKNDKRWLIPAFISLFVTIDSQIAGLVLCPIFIIHILLYSKKWQKLFSIVAGLPLIRYAITLMKLPSGTKETAVNYASRYFSFANNMVYMIFLFVFGAVWAFFKKKRLTLIILIPSLILLAGVLNLKTFALRYVSFFAFPLVLYTSLLFSFLYERYGKYILIAIFAVLIIPSNIVFPQTGVNILRPIDYNLYDYSAPEINLKDVPEGLKNEIKESVVVGYFSPEVEWYLKKPDFVVPFSMDGRGTDQISYNNTEGEPVDVYSGAPILEERPKEKYFLISDHFSRSKLKNDQAKFFESLSENCSTTYKNSDLSLYLCNNGFANSTIIMFLN